MTWANVHSYGTGVGDTFQFQFDLATGAVHLLWQGLAGQGNAYLVGFSPAGASADPGSRDLSTALATPFVLGATDLLPLQLTAAPRPVVGATVSWTTARIPEFAPGSGLHVALHVVALQPLAAPGLDLGVFGAPGCAALLASLDVTTALVGTTPTLGTSWSIPATAPLGFELFAQSLALFVPGSLPNGQNPAGLTTSNAVASRLGAW